MVSIQSGLAVRELLPWSCSGQRLSGAQSNGEVASPWQVGAGVVVVGGDGAESGSGGLECLTLISGGRLCS